MVSMEAIVPLQDTTGLTIHGGHSNSRRYDRVCRGGIEPLDITGSEWRPYM